MQTTDSSNYKIGDTVIRVGGSDDRLAGMFEGNSYKVEGFSSSSVMLVGVNGSWAKYYFIKTTNCNIRFYKNNKFK